MTIKLKYKDFENTCEGIIWDRDSVFIDFDNYWKRLAGSIAQQIAEHTTTNWDNFNKIRTLTIELLGINIETEATDDSSPLKIMPVSSFASLLTSGLSLSYKEKTRDKLHTIIHNAVQKSFIENKEKTKEAILVEELEIVKKIGSSIEQILITNDTNSNNEFFLDKTGLRNTFFKTMTDINKENINCFLNSNYYLITKNDFLKSYYNNQTLVIDSTKEIDFTQITSNTIKVFVDGASKGNPGDAGIGVLLLKDKNNQEEISEYIGTQTNNYAEYSALIKALEECIQRGYKRIEVFSDSELMVNQINKVYKVKSPDIKTLYDKATSLIKEFLLFKISHIPREENLKADKLANQAIKLK